MRGADRGTFDIGSATERISLSLDGEHKVFKRDSYQHIADGITVWSGKHVQEADAIYLYVARNGADISTKLVKGNLEYDAIKDNSGDYELRARTATRSPKNTWRTATIQSSGASQVGTACRHPGRRSAFRDHRKCGLYEGGARVLSKRNSTRERFRYRIGSHQ
jgi:hypothetical protein